MPLTNAFTQQSRQDIIKSVVNRSTSKQFWSFPKKKRFQPVKTECPVAFYQQDTSTISKRKSSFSLSKRKVFTQTTDAPLPGTYEIHSMSKTQGSILGIGRDKCLFRSYVSRQMARHPGPSDYIPHQPKKSKGYTFRPRTAYHRNYFIDDKEQKDVPGPCQYEIFIDHDGKTCSSKFKSSTLGQSLRKTQPRFSETELKTPGPSLYYPRTVSLRSEHAGGAIGNTLRKSFLDCIKIKTEEPGPGNYELPSEFGHYKASSRPQSHNQIHFAN